MSTNGSTILALDVGERKIGVARANVIARIAEPLTTIQNTDRLLDDLRALLAEYDASELVVGLPRGLEGQETNQTRYVRDVVELWKGHLTVPIHFQDEAVTSINARAILDGQKKSYTKEDVDAVAATIILDDYLKSRK